ncbi:hypothetical protein L6R52_44370 [Myxococcota bacterium]|nr:hypothetical protein [Myxococcota bacterium]
MHTALVARAALPTAPSLGLADGDDEPTEDRRAAREDEPTDDRTSHHPALFDDPSADGFDDEATVEHLPAAAWLTGARPKIETIEPARPEPAVDGESVLEAWTLPSLKNRPAERSPSHRALAALIAEESASFERPRALEAPTPRSDTVAGVSSFEETVEALPVLLTERPDDEGATTQTSFTSPFASDDASPAVTIEAAPATDPSIERPAVRAETIAEHPPERPEPTTEHTAPRDDAPTRTPRARDATRVDPPKPSPPTKPPQRRRPRPAPKR